MKSQIVLTSSGWQMWINSEPFGRAFKQPNAALVDARGTFARTANRYRIAGRRKDARRIIKDARAAGL